MTEFSRSRIITKALKDYTCTNCGHVISKTTENHVYYTSKCDEGFYKGRFCVKCVKSKYQSMARVAENNKTGTLECLTKKVL